MNILYYIKKYPLSLVVIAIVVYLSFFKPPTVSVATIPHIDKMVHFLMYAGMSGMLWIEFLRAHTKRDVPLWHGWVGALVCPVVFSGVVELLQEYCTTYRGGDWKDFAANALGAMTASLFCYYLLRPYMERRK